ncbi:tryptophan synthase subunit alpha, partial [Candidatus Aerophobetes bacterium]|nr:tryptophan synthase subunit alpha [Candidatus Aerophobetes bacterium]
STPVAVGFGVSSPSDARKMASFADAVIVGSAIIKKIMENINRQDMVEKVGTFVYSLCKSIKEDI